MTTKTTPTKINFMLLGLSMFFLLVSILIIFNIPYPSEPQYQIYKLILSLSAAGFASIIPGFIRINYRGYLSAGGGIAVFIFVLTYNPEFIHIPKSLTVHVYGDSLKGIPIKSGLMKVVFKSRTEDHQINPDGTIILQDLPKDILGKPIQFTPQIEDYNKQQKTIILSEVIESVDLILKPIPPTVCVSGSVFHNNNVLKNVIVIIDSLITRTDDFGNFSLVFPGKEGTTANIKILKGGKVIFSSTEPVSKNRKEIYIDPRININ